MGAINKSQLRFSPRLYPTTTHGGGAIFQHKTWGAGLYSSHILPWNANANGNAKWGRAAGTDWRERCYGRRGRPSAPGGTRLLWGSFRGRNRQYSLWILLFLERPLLWMDVVIPIHWPDAVLGKIVVGRFRSTFFFAPEQHLNTEFNLPLMIPVIFIPPINFGLDQ